MLLPNYPIFLTLSLFVSLTLLLPSTLAQNTLPQDPMGYILPLSGTASTTQFALGPEFASGTSCGASAWPNGINAGNPPPAGGPGFLYAAINQLGFGANPSFPNAGGPGRACGVCYNLTTPAPFQNSAIFKIIDECPAAEALQRGPGRHCTQCSAGDRNDYGQEWHFDIATDAMNQEQYNNFFAGIGVGALNWPSVDFEMAPCFPDTVNPEPPIMEWGCLDGCHNNEAASVCQGI